jgi:hypothetical protein
MTTAMETELRRDLQELADVPGPPSLADRALARAQTLRRRRAAVAGAGTLALVVLVALPFVVDVRSLGFRLPFGGSDTVPCEEATDDVKVPGLSDYPRFVRLVLSKMPPRDDYSLQSAQGMCPPFGEPEGPAGEQRQGYAVINLGPNREHGHLTVTLSRIAHQFTCDTVRTPEGGLIFCEDATATAPLVLGVRVGGDNYVIVTALYLDGRSVSIGAIGTPFDAATLRPVVTDPTVAALIS